MLRVSALTGSNDQPSSRFRVRQHITALRALGVDVVDVPARYDRHGWPFPSVWARGRTSERLGHAAAYGIKVASRFPDMLRARRGDVVWLQKELVPGIPSWEPFLGAPVAFDVDDAIWLVRPAGEFTARTLAARATVVLAGNAYLARWFEAHARRVEIVPTAVDTGRFRPLPEGEIRSGGGWGEGPTIGWVGTSANLHHLEAIAPAIAEALDRHPAARLLVVSNRAPDLSRVPTDRVEFRQWSAEREVADFQDIDIGLMPLSDGPWAQGKCAFKMLQYMACGIPVVVSPVGMNREVLDKAEVGLPASEPKAWADALNLLLGRPDRRRSMGEAGRSLVEAEYSSERVGRRLAGIFFSLRS